MNGVPDLEFFIKGEHSSNQWRSVCGCLGNLLCLGDEGLGNGLLKGIRSSYL